MSSSININNVLRRIVVGLKPSESSDFKITSFADCVVNYFSPNDVSVNIECKLHNNTLLLWPSSSVSQKNTLTEKGSKLSIDSESLGSVVLQHSPVCPIWQLPADEVQSIPESSINRGINVGVAIIVESSDSHILMTQRSEHMRTFPRAWVPPGGHLECDESLLQCGLREVQEETGLVFTDDNSETSVLCLWESVYPVMLGLGVPTSHHIVIYLHTRVKQTWKQLQTQVQLDPAEVQACAWLSTEMVEELCTGRSDGASHHIKFISDSSGNGTCPAKLDISKMFTSLLWKCGYIYSGSQLALTRWLDLHKKLDIKLASKI